MLLRPVGLRFSAALSPTRKSSNVWNVILPRAPPVSARPLYWSRKNPPPRSRCLPAHPRNVVAPGHRARLEVIVVGIRAEQPERAHRPQHRDLRRLRKQRIHRRHPDLRRRRRAHAVRVRPIARERHHRLVHRCWRSTCVVNRRLVATSVAASACAAPKPGTIGAPG